MASAGLIVEGGLGVGAGIAAGDGAEVFHDGILTGTGELGVVLVGAL